jgi:hypothetical protein
VIVATPTHSEHTGAVLISDIILRAVRPEMESVKFECCS